MNRGKEDDDDGVCFARKVRISGIKFIASFAACRFTIRLTVSLIAYRQFHHERSVFYTNFFLHIYLHID